MENILFEVIKYPPDYLPDHTTDDELPNYLFQVPSPIIHQRSRSILSVIIGWIRKICVRQPEEVFNFHNYPENVLLHEWKLALSPDGEILSIIKDSTISFRHKSTNYSENEEEYPLPLDSFSETRCVCWSLHNEYIVVSNSMTRTLYLISSNGEIMHVLTLPDLNNTDIVCLAFSESKCDLSNNPCCPDLLIIDRQGIIYRCHTPSNCVPYHPIGNQCILQSKNSTSKDNLSQKTYLHFNILSHIVESHLHTTVTGMSVFPMNQWLIVSGEDFFQSFSLSLWKIIDKPPYLHLLSHYPSSPIRPTLYSSIYSLFNNPLRLSRHQLCFSFSGRHLLSLNLLGQLSLWQIPECVPLFQINSPFPSVTPSLLQAHVLSSICWWNDEVFVRAYRDGSISLTGIDSILTNVPSDLNENFSGVLQVVSSYQFCFILESCRSYKQRRKIWTSSIDNPQSGDDDNKPLLRRTFRLYSLCSTTPLDSLLRKVEAGHYEKSLEIAQHYHLHTDIIYKHQWQHNPISPETLGLLEQIEDKPWILNECLSRVAHSLDNMRLLLKMGLDMTTFSIDKEKITSLIKNDHNMRIKCITRFSLLRYIDRLESFNKICQEIDYDPMAYAEYRNGNMADIARVFAQDANVDALTIIFQHHSFEFDCKSYGDIIQSFPATCSPLLYSSLLPKPNVQNIFSLNYRSRDFIETELIITTLLQYSFDDNIINLLTSALNQVQYHQPHWSLSDLSSWYYNRILEIDNDSGQLDICLSLCKIAVENQVTGIEQLFFDLQELCRLVYDFDLNLNLSQFSHLDEFQRLQLILKDSTPDSIIDDLWTKAAPYIGLAQPRSDRSLHPLLLRYLQTISSSNLAFFSVVINQSTIDKPDSQRIILEEKDLLELSLKIIYDCQNVDFLPIQNDIFNCLPQRDNERSNNDIEYRILQDKTDILDIHLTIAALLEKYQIRRPLSYLISLSDPNSSHLCEELVQLITRKMIKNNQNSKLTSRHWKDVFSDIDTIHEQIFSYYSISAWQSIFFSSLLSTGNFSLVKSMFSLDSCRLSSQKKLQIVLLASQEFYNSSSSLEHPNIILAQECLISILPICNEIQKEIDFIEGSLLLTMLGCDVVPLEIRISHDLLEFFQRLLESSNVIYQEYSKILHCANCFHFSLTKICKIKYLLAKCALKMGDYSFANEICGDLVKENYSPLWQLAADINNSSKNITVKQIALSQSLLFCPSEQIDSILSKWKENQATYFCQQVNIFADIPKNDRKRLIKQKMKSALSTYTSSTCHEELVTSLQINLHSFEVIDDLITTYFKNSVKHTTDNKNHNLSYTPRDEIIQILMTCLGLWDDYGSSELDDLILEFSGEIGLSKIPLLLNSLLSLQKPLYAIPFFEKYVVIDSTLTVYDLNIRMWIICSFLFFSILFLELNSKCSTVDIMTGNPMSLDQLQEEILKKLEEKKNNKISEVLLNQVSKYSNLLRQIQHTQSLLKLIPNIDLLKFENNPSCRQDVIDSLTKNDDFSKLELALKLSSFYSLSRSNIIINHIKWIFQSINSYDILKDHIMKLRHEWLRFPEIIINESRELISTIPGTDHHKLLLLLFMVNQCNHSQNINSFNVNRQEKLLELLIKCHFEIDFKLLINVPPSDMIINKLLSLINQPISEDILFFLSELIELLRDFHSSYHQLGESSKVFLRFLSQSFSQIILTYTNYTEDELSLQDDSQKVNISNKIYHLASCYFPKVKIEDIVPLFQDIVQKQSPSLRIIFLECFLSTFKNDESVYIPLFSLYLHFSKLVLRINILLLSINTLELFRYQLQRCPSSFLSLRNLIFSFLITSYIQPLSVSQPVLLSAICEIINENHIIFENEEEIIWSPTLLYQHLVEIIIDFLHQIAVNNIKKYHDIFLEFYNLTSLLSISIPEPNYSWIWPSGNSISLLQMIFGLVSIVLAKYPEKEYGSNFSVSLIKILNTYASNITNPLESRTMILYVISSSSQSSIIKNSITQEHIPNIDTYHSQILLISGKYENNNHLSSVGIDQLIPKTLIEKFNFFEQLLKKALSERDFQILSGIAKIWTKKSSKLNLENDLTMNSSDFINGIWSQLLLALVQHKYDNLLLNIIEMAIPICQKKFLVSLYHQCKSTESFPKLSLIKIGLMLTINTSVMSNKNPSKSLQRLQKEVIDDIHELLNSIENQINIDEPFLHNLIINCEIIHHFLLTPLWPRLKTTLLSSFNNICHSIALLTIDGYYLNAIELLFDFKGTHPLFRENLIGLKKLVNFLHSSQPQKIEYHFQLCQFALEALKDDDLIS